MGQESTTELKEHIGETRDELGRNLDNLQAKVKHTFDLETQFNEHPMTIIGLAFGVGVLLSAFTGRAKGRAPYTAEIPRTAGRKSQDPNIRKAQETWDKIKGALVGVATTKVQSFLEEMLPGFRSKYEKAEPDQNEAGSPELTRSAAG